MLEEFEMGIVNISGSLTLPSVICLVLWKHSEINAFLIVLRNIALLHLSAK